MWILQYNMLQCKLTKAWIQAWIQTCREGSTTKLAIFQLKARIMPLCLCSFSSKRLINLQPLKDNLMVRNDLKLPVGWAWW
jgi:hypothetical protein